MTVVLYQIFYRLQNPTDRIFMHHDALSELIIKLFVGNNKTQFLDN